MISRSNIDEYVKRAKWHINLGFDPMVQPGQSVIVMMCDGSIGYGMHYKNYCWSLIKTAYPIKKYAVFNAGFHYIQPSLRPF